MLYYLCTIWLQFFTMHYNDDQCQPMDNYAEVSPAVSRPDNCAKNEGYSIVSVHNKFNIHAKWTCTNMSAFIVSKYTMYIYNINTIYIFMMHLLSIIPTEHSALISSCCCFAVVRSPIIVLSKETMLSKVAVFETFHFWSDIISLGLFSK